MRAFAIRSVFLALMAYVVSHFQSHESLRLENMALRHQLAVYQHSVKRPKLRPSDRLFWSWLALCSAIIGSPSAPSAPEAADAWETFLQLGEGLATTDTLECETLTKAVLAMRR